MAQIRTDTDIPSAFRATAARRGEAPAVVSDAGVTSFAELDRQSDRLAAHLAAGGLQVGERVALYAVNGAAFAAAYLGIQKAGGVVVPVNLLLNPEEIDYLLTDSGATAFVYHPAMAEGVAAVRERAVQVGQWISLGDPLAEGDTGWAAIQAGLDPAPRVMIDPRRDLAALLYTSGTTGRPKGAMLTHANLVSNTDSVTAALELSEDDRLLVVLPMFHAFAATVGMLTPLLHGFSFVPLPRFEPAQVARAIGEHGATVFLGVPSMYALLLRLPDEAAAPLEGLRFCVSGGAAMPQAVMAAFEERFGVPLLEGDGPTECGPVTCVNPRHGARKPGTVGLPVPGVTMEIRDREGRPLPDGETGEICVRGPSVMRGYWNRPDETAASFFDDFFRTGDLGVRDADGYFAIIDRLKDLIIVNGMNVYPRVVEEVLYRHPAVAEAAVVGQPHELHGEIPVAYVALKEGQTADERALRGHCRAHLGRHEVPRRFVFMDALPKNATGKILKRELRKAGEVERGVVTAD